MRFNKNDIVIVDYGVFKVKAIIQEVFEESGQYTPYYIKVISSKMCIFEVGETYKAFQFQITKYSEE